MHLAILLIVFASFETSSPGQVDWKKWAKSVASVLNAFVPSGLFTVGGMSQLYSTHQSIAL
jgi:hypothetical protein